MDEPAPSTPLPAALPAARRLIVVGASTPLGNALFQAATAQGRATIGTGFRHASAPLVSLDLLTQTLPEAVPDLGPGDAVVLVAARSDPAWVFENPYDSRALNVDAALHAADDTLAAGARLILVSTELVFDGVRGGYAEGDTTQPTTLFGRQRVEVEEAIRASPGSWAVVRTGWNVGWEKDPRCLVFQTYRTLLQRGARMAEDHVFTLTDATDTAAALLQLADRDDCGVWHLVSAPPLSRTDLADWVIAGSRHAARMRYDRVRYAEIPSPEPVPERSWIVNHKAVQKLHLTFAEPWRTVERKVALIDSWYDDRQKRIAR